MYKKIFGVVLFLVLIFVISFYYLSTYVVTLKPVIEKGFKSQTGYSLQIDSIHFFKKGIFSFSRLELNNVVVKDSQGKVTLAKIKSIKLKIKLYRLLFKELVVRKIEVDGLTLFTFHQTEQVKKTTDAQLLASIFNKIIKMDSLDSVSIINATIQKNKSDPELVLKSLMFKVNRFFKTISLSIISGENKPFSFAGNYQESDENKISLSNVTINYNKLADVEFSQIVFFKLKDSIIIEMKNEKFGGGKLTVNYKVDNSFHHELTIDGQQIDIITFLKLFTNKQLPIKDGKINMDVKLSSSGEDMQKILDNLKGNVYIHSNEVTIMNTKLSKLGGDLVFATVGALLPFGDKKKEDKVTCFTLNLPVNNGKAFFKNRLAMETKSIVITADGSLSLPNNSIALNLFPVPRKEIIMSLSSFTNKISINGSLLSPKTTVGSSAKGLLSTGANVGAAVLTGGLSLLATSLYHIAVTKDYHPCVNISRK